MKYLTYIYESSACLYLLWCSWKLAADRKYKETDGSRDGNSLFLNLLRLLHSATRQNTNWSLGWSGTCSIVVEIGKWNKLLFVTDSIGMSTILEENWNLSLSSLNSICCTMHINLRINPSSRLIIKYFTESVDRVNSSFRF